MRYSQRALETFEERFRTHVQWLPTGCLIWTGQRDRKGYGHFWAGRYGPSGKPTQDITARVAYEHWIGPIPEGLTIDHLCRQTSCVNPWHLEPVTNRENIMRGRPYRVLRTHCKRGHEFTPENTYQIRYRSQGGRKCRQCQLEGRRARKRAR